MDTPFYRGVPVSGSIHATLVQRYSGNSNPQPRRKIIKGNSKGDVFGLCKMGPQQIFYKTGVLHEQSSHEYFHSIQPTDIL